MCLSFLECFLPRMKHYVFYFQASLLYRGRDDDDECSDDDRTNTSASGSTSSDNDVFDEDDIVDWYNDQCADNYYDAHNASVRYDQTRGCYVLEFDINGSYEDAKFAAELLVDPDDDGNYPVKSEGQTCLIYGELCDDGDYEDEDEDEDEDEENENEDD